MNLLRVPPEVELEGLDLAEFQQDFYPEFERVPEIIVDARRPGGRGAPTSCSRRTEQTNGNADDQVGA